MSDRPWDECTPWQSFQFIPISHCAQDKVGNFVYLGVQLGCDPANLQCSPVGWALLQGGLLLVRSHVAGKRMSCPISWINGSWWLTTIMANAPWKVVGPIWGRAAPLQLGQSPPLSHLAQFVLCPMEICGKLCPEQSQKTPSGTLTSSALSMIGFFTALSPLALFFLLPKLLSWLSLRSVAACISLGKTSWSFGERKFAKCFSSFQGSEDLKSRESGCRPILSMTILVLSSMRDAATPRSVRICLTCSCNSGAPVPPKLRNYTSWQRGTMQIGDQWESAQIAERT